MAAEPPLSGATIAFDLDGTLVDTAPDLMGTLNVILGEEGLPHLPLEAGRALIGHGARRLLQRGFEAAGAPLPPGREPELFDRFLVHYSDHLADHSRAFPGVPEALEALASEGARLTVCTNKPTELSVALLGTLGLAGYFSAIVGPDLAPARKPDPRHLALAVETAGGSLGKALMVGDAITDAEAARAAGLPLILVSFGYTEIPAVELAPDALIHHFDELVPAALRLVGACRA